MIRYIVKLIRRSSFTQYQAMFFELLWLMKTQECCEMQRRLNRRNWPYRYFFNFLDNLVSIPFWTAYIHIYIYRERESPLCGSLDALRVSPSRGNIFQNGYAGDETRAYQLVKLRLLRSGLCSETLLLYATLCLTVAVPVNFQSMCEIALLKHYSYQMRILETMKFCTNYLY